MTSYTFLYYDYWSISLGNVFIQGNFVVLSVGGNPIIVSEWKTNRECSGLDQFYVILNWLVLIRAMNPWHILAVNRWVIDSP